MAVCNDKICEAVIGCCESLKPSLCGVRGVVMPETSCKQLRLEGVDDVTINQGIGINLADGVHAYDGDGNEIEVVIDPNEIDKCDVGIHSVKYTAMGKGDSRRPITCGKNALDIGTACDDLTSIEAVRTVTIEQIDPPTISGIEDMEVADGTVFDPMDGVSAIDGNGNSVDVEFEGDYPVAVSGEIATFDNEIDKPLRSLKVTLEPIQDGTPWMGSDVYNEPYLLKSSPQIGHEYNAETLRKVIGGTVAWNQLAGNTWRGDQTQGGIEYKHNADGTFTLNGTATVDDYWAVTPYGSNTTIVGHKYLIAEANHQGSPTTFGLGWASRNIIAYGNTCAIVSATTTGGAVAYVYKNGAVINNATLKPMLIDLTAMFGSTIADYIYSLEQATAGAGVAFFKSLFPSDYYPYDSGTLKSVEGVSAHVMRDASDTVVGSYPLDDSLTLRGIPKLDSNNQLYYDGDTYESDGTVTRKYGIVDLGTLNWQYYNNGIFYTQSLPQAKPTSLNIICENYIAKEVPLTNPTDKTVWMAASGSQPVLRVCDTAYTDATSFKTAMNGIYLVYELATPTTETADPYTNPQTVDPSGTEQFVSTGIVPVGHETGYMNVAPISGHTEVVTHVSPTTSASDGETYTIDLGRTVYGGVLDVVSGELVVDRAMVTFDGSADEVWLAYASQSGFLIGLASIGMAVGTAQNGYANWLEVRQDVSGMGVMLGSNNAYMYVAHITDNITEVTDLSTWKAYLANNPLEVVYPLATPQTYTLTAQQISLLMGTNNVWSDSGEVAVVYTKALPQSGSVTLLEGVYYVTYTAEDECGNKTEVTRRIVVGDGNKLCKMRLCEGFADCGQNRTCEAYTCRAYTACE